MTTEQTTPTQPDGGPAYDLANLSPEARSRVEQHLAAEMWHRGRLTTRREVYAHATGKTVRNVSFDGAPVRLSVFTLPGGASLDVPAAVWDAAQLPTT